ncbi:MAG: NAD(P)/FAD-dependent oxidoreductase [Nocardioides sp.]|nr:NAD(P)/FAD-dependent oxidoreductase [Nocardioides sp.]
MPSFVLVSEQHADYLLDEFGRYIRDDELHTARSCVEAVAVAVAVTEQIIADGGTVALFVADSQLPDEPVLVAFGRWRAVAPNARRMIAAHWEHFLRDAPGLRTGMAKGTYDAYLLMPRGVRDEEFHHAVTDLLSDWGSAVADPESVATMIISPVQDTLTLAIRDFLDRMGMPNRVYDPESEAGLAVRALLPADSTYPLVHALNKAPVQARSVRDVATAAFDTPGKLNVSGTMDVAVVGGGPAGLAAAGYAASEGLSVAVLEAEAIGGQAGTSSMLRNYLGFPRGISGMRLAQRARSQALRFGAECCTGWEVTRLETGAPGEPHVVHADGGTVSAHTIVVAYRKLRVEPLEELVGLGVHYGAALTAAREMEDADVYVVGGGNSAGQAAVHLSRFAASVTILVRRPTLAETMSAYLVGEIEHHPRITVRTGTQVVDGGGEGRLQWLCLEDTDTGARTRHEAQGLFLLLGAEPHCEWLPPVVARDDQGFVLTGRDVPGKQRADGLPPASLATTAPGVFAVGDIRSGSMKRVAAASGEGASVVPLVHAYLAPVEVPT